MTARKPDLTMVKVAYHRNGIGGEGFHVVLFDDRTFYDIMQTQRLIGFVFKSEGHVAVIDPALAAGDVIEMGPNSWRGDWYEPTLRAMVQAYEEDQYESSANQL